jgi:2-polyprenyl-3-methyl-5-hydroxy-6-metoxy-1,4-benzoquinol methylase
VDSRQSKNIDDSVYDNDWIQSAWGESTDEFIKNPGANIRPRVQRSIDLAELKPGMTILDVGCGRGEVVFHCARLGCNATGIDFSQQVLDVAEQAHKNLDMSYSGRAKFIRGDVNKVDFPEKSFDRIFMLDLVEHLYDPQLTELYQTSRKLLKDDGLLIIHTLPNRWIYKTYSVARIILPWLDKDPRNEYEKKIHINEQSCVSVKQLLRTCDFQSAVKVEDGFLAQAEWYKGKAFGDKRDKIYKFLRRPIVKMLLKFIGNTPLRLLLMNDIYAVAAKSPEILKKINFKNGLYEGWACLFLEQQNS